MRPVLTAAQTQALDRETEARGVPIERLMERAGLAVARAAAGLAGGSYGRRGVVVCGKGNNAGDGMVAARYLASWGMGVTAVILAPPAELREPAGTNLRRLRATSVRTPTVTGEDAGERTGGLASLTRALDRADVAVDAIFGTGFRGVAEGIHRGAIEALNASRVPVVAVDIPSGVEGDTGAVRGAAVRAATTVALGAPKVGDVLFPGALLAGVVEVADIGFPEDLVAGDVLLVERADARALVPQRHPEDHKRRSGVVLVLAGSSRMTGAPLLVAEGAYRAGAGLVRVGVPEGILGTVQAGLAEATFLGLPEGRAGSVAAAAWEVIADELEGVDAVAIGPGLSTDDEAPELARRLVRESSVPVVVDADAINAFAGRPAELAERRVAAVITPHTGEFGRLFGMPASEVAEDRVGFARKAAAETRAVTLLKGPRTLVALPEGEVRVNPTGTPVLATGGTGDVLTGAIAAYLARGLPGADAATLAAYVHGVAGEVAGERLGEGATSGDVAASIPEAVRRVREAP